VTAALRKPVGGPADARFPAVPECTMPPGDTPCAHTECRYHLARRDYWSHQLKPTRDCALAVANEGPHSLEEIAQVLGMTRERARQIEASAIAKLEKSGALRRFFDESD
jgi:hypothetical protein